MCEMNNFYKGPINCLIEDSLEVDDEQVHSIAMLEPKHCAWQSSDVGHFTLDTLHWTGQT